MRDLVVFLLSASVFLVPPLQSQPSPPAMRFLPEGPVVESISPGATVSTLVVARIPLGDSQRVQLRADRATARAGETRLVLPWEGEVPSRSVFAAVDGATGEVALGTPGATLGVPLERLPELSVAAGAERVTLPGGWLAVLVVRPGGGAWVAKVADGTEGDADGIRDEAATLTPAAFAPIEAGGPTLTAFEVRDVLVAIEIDRFQVSTARVGGAQ